MTKIQKICRRRALKTLYALDILEKRTKAFNRRNSEFLYKEKWMLLGRLAFWTTMYEHYSQKL